MAALVIFLRTLEEEWGAWLEATYDPDWTPYDRLEDTDPEV